jgi:O-antigen biosynthesis protein
VRADTIFDEPHHRSIELLAFRALVEGNAGLAFRLADRRCRISPVPESHSYVLRAEASFQMGDKVAAMCDIAQALLVAPEDIAANRRALAWGEERDQQRAARVLIERDRDTEVLRRAMEVLGRGGQRVFTKVTVFNDAVEGWAVWDEQGPLEITVTDDVDSVIAIIEPEPEHIFCDIGRASNFRLSRPMSTNAQSILLSIAQRVFYSTRAASNDRKPIRRAEPLRPQASRDARVTVVVPVYSDYDATRICLESLLSTLTTNSSHQVMLVNDATPDKRIAWYLAKVAARPSVRLLTNARNLGFVGTVNRALSHIPDGDVVLLNSDTIVPPGFLDRLAAAAASSSDIGTITPLSNDGDLVGFPLPHTANPIGSLETIKGIDKIAAEVNAGRIVDIPNGVGFCLYVTRSCLNAVGPLSENFYRGYLEDVDFCLRARERGFRNICAPSIYVGHAGSRSFRTEKRALVVRNLKVLEGRFPRYRHEYGAYDLLDPLRPYREAIERRIGSPSDRPRLVVTGAGIVGAVARERARHLTSQGQPAMVLELRHGARGPTLHVADASGGVPQSIQFALSSADERASSFDYVRKLRPSRIEILDPAKLPPALADLFLDLEVPYDMFIADAGLFGHTHERFSLTALRSHHGHQVCETNPTSSSVGRDIAEQAERILVPCEQALAFATSFLPPRTLWRIERCGTRLRRTRRSAQPRSLARLGLLPLRSCAEEQRLMMEIARALRGTHPDLSLTVLGATLDDIGLMRIGNTFVTGAVGPMEFGRVAKAYGLQALFVTVARPLYGHPILTRAFNSSLPTAFFDWSMGRCKTRRGDLSLDPHASLGDIIAALGRWMPKS